MTWNPNPAARREILAAMKSRRRALTALEIARLVGKADSSVRQMLYTMFRDGVVTCDKGGVGKAWLWKRTGKRLPKRVTSTAKPTREESRSRFAHCGDALAAALGMNNTPAVPANVRTHKIEGGRQ